MRWCHEVINQMLLEIPSDKTELIADLKWNREDSMYKPPESNTQWVRTHITLVKHIPKPELDWEFKVLSVFTTKSVEELKKMI